MAIFLFCSAWLISTTLSSNLLIYSSVLSNLLLIPSSVFLISVILFFCSVWLFFLFSNFHCAYPFFFQVHWASFCSLPRTLHRIDCLSPLCLVLLGFYIIPFLGTYFFVISFYLILCVYLYVLGRMHMFSDLAEVALCRRCPRGPSSTLPSDNQSYMIWGCPLCRLSVPFCCVGASYCGHALRQGWSLVHCPDIPWLV